MNWTSTKTWLDDLLVAVEALSPLACVATGLIYHRMAHQAGSVEGEQLARDVVIAGLGMIGAHAPRYAREQLSRPRLLVRRSGEDFERDLRHEQVSATIDPARHR